MKNTPPQPLPLPFSWAAVVVSRVAKEEEHLRKRVPRMVKTKHDQNPVLTTGASDDLLRYYFCLAPRCYGKDGSQRRKLAAAIV